MTLGFYYHIPLNSTSVNLRVPAYLGVFLDSLAQEVSSLILFMHEANSIEEKHCDYNLRASNIIYYTLGPKTPAWDRFLWPRKTLKIVTEKVRECDTLLVRAPSPLAPMFWKEFSKRIRIVYLIVGDYTEGLKYLDQQWWRKLLITILSQNNDRQLSSAIRNSRALVNSQKLFEKYEAVTSDLHLIKTTTLTQKDFYYRDDTCQGDEIKILYTGSYSFSKGLRELVDAFALLSKEGKDITLNFVGWDYAPSKPMEKYLKNQAHQLGVGERVFFHGFKTVGPELNAMYRMADIYVFPSYQEGFPRTIWEAMANGLPVIATGVGGIPSFLTNEKNALLIKPRSVKSIMDAISRVIIEKELRKRLILNGLSLAGENTLEIQSKAIVSILTKTYDE